MNTIQLDLFAPPAPLQIGQRVECPLGIGSVYAISPDCATSREAIWVGIGNTARPYDFNQVSVLEEGGDQS